MKRTWEQIDELVISSIIHLQKYNRPTTTERLHVFIGTGVYDTHAGNTEQLLRRMRKHGLIEQTDRLEWVLTPIGKQMHKERIRNQTIERFRKHLPSPERGNPTTG